MRIQRSRRVIDGSHVARTHEEIRAAGDAHRQLRNEPLLRCVPLPARPMNLQRTRIEIIQRRNAGNDGRKLRRNSGIGNVGDMLLPVDHEAVDLGMERRLHLVHGSGELDGHIALRHLVHRESLPAQPGNDLRHIFRRRPVLLPKLLRGQKVVEVRRVLIFNRSQVLSQHHLLPRGAFQHQQLALRPQRYRRRPAIELRPRQRM